jgi:hypothetical protein
MKYQIIAIAVLLCCSAFAQDRATKFWDQQRIVANTFAYSMAGLDIVQSCQLARRHQGYEVAAPTQTCGGITGWVVGGQMLQTGLQYWLQKKGHPKLSHAVPWVSFAGSSEAVVVTFALR